MKLFRTCVISVVCVGVSLTTGSLRIEAQEIAADRRGVFSEPFLTESASILDIVMAGLRNQVLMLRNNSGAVPHRVAGEIVSSEFSASRSVDISIRLNSLGQIEISGSTGGEGIRETAFSGVGDRSQQACEFLLNTVADYMVGPARMNVSGRLIPVVSYLQMMGAFQRNPGEFERAAEILWLNTVVEFNLYEAASNKDTRCMASAEPTGWSQVAF